MKISIATALAAMVLVFVVTGCAGRMQDEDERSGDAAAEASASGDGFHLPLCLFGCTHPDASADSVAPDDARTDTAMVAQDAQDAGPNAQPDAQPDVQPDAAPDVSPDYFMPIRCGAPYVRMLTNRGYACCTDYGFACDLSVCPTTSESRCAAEISANTCCVQR